MSGERGSAVVAAGTGTAVLVMLSIMSMLFHSHVAEANPMNYKLTWESPPQNNPQYYANKFKRTKWDAKGKIFFRFNATYNAYAVDANGYKSCKLSVKNTPITSGGDGYTLESGLNYFICSFADHCSKGMKLQVNATSN